MATLTIYPDPGDPGTTTADTIVGRTGVDETLTVIRSGDGTLVNQTGTQNGPQFFSSGTTNQFTSLIRILSTFDTSPLSTIAQISSVSLNLWGVSKVNSLGSPDFNVAGATPSSNNDFVAADYTQVQTTLFGGVTYANFTTGAYNNLALNASGIANINKTGISKFSYQLNWDLENNYTGVWASNTASNLVFRMADNAGTSEDPNLVITYSILKPSFNGGTFKKITRPAAFSPGLAR